ncbi:hypothetical protein [Enterococcus avium]|nr:hypothetical protein [Enterococcus avium]
MKKRKTIVPSRFAYFLFKQHIKPLRKRDRRTEATVFLAYLQVYLI